MEQYKQRIDEFRKMANFADQLEDADDDGRALAVRIALYDRVSDMADEVQREIQARFGGEDGMNRAASAGGDDAMTKEAQWYNTLWKGIKGIGSGLLSAIRRKPRMSKEVGKSIGDAAEAVAKGGGTGGQKALNWMLGPDPTKGRLIRQVGNVGEYAATPLGRGLAIGVPAAAALGGAGTLAGHGREPEQQVGGYPDSRYRGLPITYRDHGPGPMALPPSGMPTVAPSGGMVGPAYRDFQQVVSDLRDMDGRLLQLEARIQRIETGR
jgi:hypothetical protein